MKLYNIEMNFKGHVMKYNDYYLINNLEEYKYYLEELNNKFIVSESEIKTLNTFIGHGHSLLTGIAGTLGGGMKNNIDEREPMLAALKVLQGTVICNQLKNLIDGYKLAINKKGGYFMIKDSDEYTATEVGKDVYTESDVITHKWWGGQHYYVKVGNIDVIDALGNVKWNSEKTAMEIGILYMNKLNER
jgi:hypothetical protein